MIHRQSALLSIVAMAVIACSSSGTEPASVVDGDILETASIRIDSSAARTLVATLTLENLAAADRQILWGEDCIGNGPLDVRMYRGDVLVWESARAGPLLECPVRAIQSTMSAKGSVSFERQMAIAGVLGDSLAGGVYRFTVQSTVAAPVLSAHVDVGSLTVADPIAVPPGTNLSGLWNGSTGGLSVSLALTWTADSVYGSGTYGSSATGGACVVPSLHTAGSMSLAARRAGDVVTGGFVFDVGYGPPYGGRLRSATQFDGVIHSVDAGGCALVLTRSR
jgi:hypothetical protein